MRHQAKHHRSSILEVREGFLSYLLQSLFVHNVGVYDRHLQEKSGKTIFYLMFTLQVHLSHFKKFQLLGTSEGVVLGLQKCYIISRAYRANIIVRV